MLILSIPFYNNRFLKSTLKKYQNDYDLFEIRLDYNANYQVISPEFLSDKIILTYRFKTDVTTNYKKDLYAFISQLACKYGCLVDCDFLDNEILKFVPENQRILSIHGDYSEQDFSKLVDSMLKIKAKYYKIAVQINQYKQLVELKTVLSKKNENNIICLGLGPLALISRVLYKNLGSQATYIGIRNHLTHPDQICHEQVKLYNVKTNDLNTKIGGIIGGFQVVDSLGLKAFNNLFQNNKLNAVYLPLPTSSLADLFTFLNEFKPQLYGFSITMPYKKVFSKELYGIEKPNNTYLPQSNEFLNTDLLAFKKSLKYLKIALIDKILILGTGSTSEMISELLLEHKEKYIWGRNNQNLATFKACYDYRNFQQEQDYDLIINCTPLLLSPSFFSETLRINFPKKIIDLVYQYNKCDVKNIAKERNSKIVDGKRFWKWQNQLQKKLFLRIINGKS